MGLTDGELLAQRYEEAGLPRALARDVARCQAAADVLGARTHGTVLADETVEKIRSGDIGAAMPSIKTMASATATWDAAGGPGHSAALRAARWAGHAAREGGVAAALVVNSTNFGAAGVYAGLAATCAGAAVVFSRTSRPSIDVRGSHDPILLNMPLAVAVQRHGDRLFLVDGAIGGASWRRLHQMRSSGPGGRIGAWRRGVRGRGREAIISLRRERTVAWVAAANVLMHALLEEGPGDPSRETTDAHVIVALRAHPSPVTESLGDALAARGRRLSGSSIRTTALLDVLGLGDERC